MTTTSTTETGIEITIATADSADADVRERRFASKGTRSVEIVISVSGANGLAVGYAATKNGGRSWSAGPRRAYRTADAGRRAADQQWTKLLQILA